MSNNTIDKIILASGIAAASIFLPSCGQNTETKPVPSPAVPEAVQPAETYSSSPAVKAAEESTIRAQEILKNLGYSTAVEPVAPAVVPAEPVAEPVVPVVPEVKAADEPKAVAPVAPAVVPAEPVAEPVAPVVPEVKAAEPKIIVPAEPKIVAPASSSEIYKALGVSPEWITAQAEREKTGDSLIGLDFYDPVETPWGSNLGNDGFRLTLRGLAYAGTDMWKVKETAKLELEPFKELRGKNGLRLTLGFDNINEGYERGLDVSEQDADIGITKYLELGKARLMLGLEYDLRNWDSNGNDAPDMIRAHYLGGKIGLMFPELGITSVLGYKSTVDGEYEIFDLNRDYKGDDLFFMLKYDSQSKKWFVGGEFERTTDDFADAMKTIDDRFTLFGGVNDLKYVDTLALGLTYQKRDNDVGEDYGRLGAELRARWKIGSRGWIGAGLTVKETAPESDRDIDLGATIGGGISF